MPVRKTRKTSTPTVEERQRCISILQILKPKFEAMQKQPEIDHNELESLTKRFSNTVVDLYGADTQQSERYEDWSFFFHPSYNTNDPQHVFHQKVQKAYQNGLKRTLTDLNAVIEQQEIELQHAGVTKMTASAEIELVLQLCQRLDKSIKVLGQRHAGRPAFEINDEYDVQDLLQAILRAYFKYSTTEEPISKLAGLSTRADFAIEELGLIIEAKIAHGPGDQGRIVKEFAEDVQGYSKWSHLKHLIYLVYNADDLKDPEALDQLTGAKMSNGKHFQAYVVRC